MSTDYTRKDTVIKVVAPTDLLPSGAYPSSTTATFRRGTTWSYDKPYMIRGMQVTVVTTGAQNGHTITLEKSNTSGSFASPTTLCTVTLGTANTQNTTTGQQTALVADADGDIAVGECVRIKHTTSTAGDASLVYVAEVFGSPRFD
jgi:hypothetical protein